MRIVSQDRGLTEDAADAGSLTTVRVEEVSRGTVTEVLRYVADLRPGVEVVISSPVAERVVKFPYKNGDPIEEGDLVALIRKDAVRKGLAQIDAQVEALEVQIANQEQEVERAKRLFRDNVITRQSLDQADTALKASRGRPVDALRSL